jgi:hypothetical protein
MKESPKTRKEKVPGKTLLPRPSCGERKETSQQKG